MFERFADQAREAVTTALNEARHSGTNQIDCEHLLIALASADTGRATDNTAADNTAADNIAAETAAPPPASVRTACEAWPPSTRTQPPTRSTPTRWPP